MTVYGIEEEELESIGDANHNFTLWRSISAAAAVLVIGRIWDMLNSETVTFTARGFSVLAASVSFVAFMISRRYAKMRNSRLDRIKARSRPIEQ